MADFVLRPACEKDREKIISIFTASFGDGEAFVRELTECADLISSACCAEMDGEVRSCMFAFHGIAHGSLRLSYLYALCTEPAYRGLGLGRAVTEYSALRARENGAQAVFLRAADARLQSWYMSVMGAAAAAPSAPVKVQPIASEVKAEEISAEEYMSLRRGSWLLPEKLLLAQDCVNRHFGGAFLRLGKDCLCAEKTESGILIREMFASDPAPVLAAAADHFAEKELYVLQSDADGKPLLFLPPLPDDTLSLLPCFPFLLD